MLLLQLQLLVVLTKSAGNTAARSGGPCARWRDAEGVCYARDL
jgi:hypothetical protein